MSEPNTKMCHYCADGGHCEWYCHGDSFDPKYRWHNLKKNPKDLPHGGQDIICVYELKAPASRMYEMGMYEEYGNFFPGMENYDMERWSVIAWMARPTFNEE